MKQANALRGTRIQVWKSVDSKCLCAITVCVVCVYYSWMNRKARAEGCKWKGYLCYEAGKAATCMTECPPHTLIWVREGLRAGGVVGEGRV